MHNTVTTDIGNALSAFDTRKGYFVVQFNEIESWFEDDEGADHQAEIISTSNTSNRGISEVWTWNWPGENWICIARYKAGKRVPMDYDA